MKTSDQLLLSVCTQEPTCYHPGVCGNILCSLVRRHTILHPYGTGKLKLLDMVLDKVSFRAFPLHLLPPPPPSHCCGPQHHLHTLKTRRKQIHSGLCDACHVWCLDLQSDTALVCSDDSVGVIFKWYSCSYILFPFQRSTSVVIQRTFLWWLSSAFIMVCFVRSVVEDWRHEAKLLQSYCVSD